MQAVIVLIADIITRRHSLFHGLYGLYGTIFFLRLSLLIVLFLHTALCRNRALGTVDPCAYICTVFNRVCRLGVGLPCIVLPCTVLLSLALCARLPALRSAAVRRPMR